MLNSYYEHVFLINKPKLQGSYALEQITAGSEEFKEANETFEKPIKNILADALRKEDHHEEKRLVDKLHEACSFDLEEPREGAEDNFDALYKHPSIVLPKLEAVLKEVLRIYPIAPFINIGYITFEVNVISTLFYFSVVILNGLKLFCSE